MSEPSYRTEDVFARIEGKLDIRLDRMESNLNSRLDKLESQIQKLDEKVDKKFELVEKRLTALEIGQAEIKREIKALDERLSGDIKAQGEKIQGLSKRVDNSEFTNRGILIAIVVARGKPRDQFTAVKIDNTQQVYYLFKTKDLTQVANVATQDLIDLGHIVASAVPAGSISFLAANAPKPPRVVKKIGNAAGSQKTAGTFCAVDKLKAALGNGWNLAKAGRRLSLSGASGSTIALARISTGGYYAFPMNSADFTANKEALGLEDKTTVTTDAEKAKVFRASSLPRPGKAKKVLQTGATFSSFYSHDASLTDFDVISSEVLI